ncbi:MAG: WXG100 family type VII secretion target [Candidatus Ancillula sp.]|jgi:WXG100 family type VII secretion target|nr:WXG100 family type VII secretion target [Candidatus Ancillula sp.]
MAMNVQYDELNNVRQELEKGRETIYQQLDVLRNRINSLVQSGFVTDRSSAAFNEAYTRYNDGARTTIQGLDDVVAFLQKVENTLRDADSQLAAAIG